MSADAEVDLGSLIPVGDPSKKGATGSSLVSVAEMNIAGTRRRRQAVRDDLGSSSGSAGQWTVVLSPMEIRAFVLTVDSGGW